MTGQSILKPDRSDCAENQSQINYAAIIFFTKSHSHYLAFFFFFFFVMAHAEWMLYYFVFS